MSYDEMHSKVARFIKLLSKISHIFQASKLSLITTNSQQRWCNNWLKCSQQDQNYLVYSFHIIYLPDATLRSAIQIIIVLIILVILLHWFAMIHWFQYKPSSPKSMFRTSVSSELNVLLMLIKIEKIWETSQWLCNFKRIFERRRKIDYWSTTPYEISVVSTNERNIFHVIWVFKRVVELNYRTLIFKCICLIKLIWLSQFDYFINFWYNLNNMIKLRRIFINLCTVRTIQLCGRLNHFFRQNTA